MISGFRVDRSRASSRAGRTCGVATAFIAVWALAPAASAHSPNVVSGLAQGHAYRHGVVPPRGQKSTASALASSSGNLSYGGGVSGVGVSTGAPRVYLVFWGSQWGAQSTNSQGNVTLSGDRNAMAPYLEAFIKGIGTGGELWSGVLTQYCQGVSLGAQTCPGSAQHVRYPTGGALAGVWVDESSAAPSQATGHQLGVEAVNAATHFANTTQSSNRSTQYVIVSPTGTNPDGFNTLSGRFCAWHDYTGDSTLSGGSVNSADGLLAFTNLPYVTDMGTSCGQNFVNSGSAGTLDGVSIVEGHEYAETVTDQFPAGGWTDTSGNENGDKCAWISSGQGASQNLALATGMFAVQSTWANDFSNGSGGCAVSHAIVTNGSANTVTVTNPGRQTSTVGVRASLRLRATDSGSATTFTYSATGLPAGLSINRATGLISGTPTTAATSSVTVTAKDSTGASGNTAFTWTVSSPGSRQCTAKQLLGNPGFETGSAAPWSSTPGVISPSSSSEPAHSGSYVAWLDGYGTAHTDTLAQTIAVPSGCSHDTLSFWLHIDTAETTASTAYDTLGVQVLSSSGSVLGTLATYSNLDAASGYTQRTFSFAPYAGQTVTLKFTGTEGPTLQTTFVIDDTALNVP